MPSNFPQLIQLEISQRMIWPQIRLTPTPCSFHNATEPPVLPVTRDLPEPNAIKQKDEREEGCNLYLPS